ncbi:MAG TPA: cation diffusion facilitator family transporter [Clostridia bacterium]|nr:cation diffusion facilitator family transporter [Clostridia bacterium]
MTRDRLKRSLRATFVGMTVNASLAIIKLLAGIAGHSHALVADAVESLADVFSSLVVWRGLVVASEPADEDHPYGHGKAEPIAAAVVSTMLLGAAAWIAVTAVREIVQPHQSPAPFTLLVLVVVIATKETLFRFVLSESAQVESTAVETDAWHHRSDAITSGAAFVGIAIALIGGEGYEAADDVAAAVAALIIAWNGWRLLRKAVEELMDRSPNRSLIEKIRTAGARPPEVCFVEKCLVRKMGYGYYVDMHVHVDPNMTVRQAHTIAHKVKQGIQTEVPSVQDVLVHIEPAAEPGPAFPPP